MVSLQRILALDCTRAKLTASSRKRALEHASEILASHYGLNARLVLEQLLARERLGSTALGDGVAIPHCRFEDCDSAIGALLSLDTAIDYDAPDDNKVDLLFVLLVPTDAASEHLQILSELAGLFINASNREMLRSATSNESLHASLLQLCHGNAGEAA